MAKAKLPDKFPDHGDPSTWAELSGEETRCLIGLANYYKVFEDRDPTIAFELAWIDLKKEHTRLVECSWFK